MKKRMHYVLAGTALGRLEAAYAHRRHFNNLKALLYEIGCWCFESRTDGVFNIAILRLLPLTSHLRTLLYAHFPALRECGAVEACGDDTYRIVGFDEYNLSARRLDERRKQAQEDWRVAQRRYRAAKTVTVSIDSVKAQPHKKGHSSENSPFSFSCPAQPTEPTSPQTDISVTNLGSVSGPSREVGSTTGRPRQGDPGKAKPVSTPTAPAAGLEPMDKTLAQLIERAKQSVERNHAARRCAEIREAELRATECELASDNPAPTPKPQSALRHAPQRTAYPVRRAKKPKRKTALNEQVIEVFKQRLHVHLSPQQTRDFWLEMQERHVCAEDLQYAAWSVEYQRKKKRHIHDPLAYARKVVLSQAILTAPPCGGPAPRIGRN